MQRCVSQRSQALDREIIACVNNSGYAGISAEQLSNRIGASEREVQREAVKLARLGVIAPLLCGHVTRYTSSAAMGVGEIFQVIREAADQGLSTLRSMRRSREYDVAVGCDVD